MSALLQGLPQFEQARCANNGIASRQAIFELGRVLRVVTGPTRAAALLDAARRGRSRLRRAPSPAGST